MQDPHRDLRMVPVSWLKKRICSFFQGQNSNIRLFFSPSQPGLGTALVMEEIRFGVGILLVEST
jgi:hypothetical protein